MQIQSNKINPDHLFQMLYDFNDFQHKEIFHQCKYPWQVLKKIQSYLQSKLLYQSVNKGTLIGSVYIDNYVYIGQGTVIEHGAMIKGPCIIGKNCELRKGAYIRGNVIIGDGCIIGNSSEIKNSILIGKCQIPHFNYVGDSILGKYAHLAAGVITSNLKLDSTPIFIKFEDKKINTELIKVGAFIGDKCEIGCNCVLNPGVIIGKGSVIYPGVWLRQHLPINSICKITQTHEIISKSQK